LYWKWRAESYFSSITELSAKEKITIILTSYNEERARNLEPFIRVLLKCSFVEKIILSNHNPELPIEKWIKIKNDRFVLIDQPVKRECGFRWTVAIKEDADYFIVIDDDILIKQKQISLLFLKLIKQPETPHGLAGFLKGDHKIYQESDVDTLCNIYAVSKNHIRLYFKFSSDLTKNGSITNEMIGACDDIIISQTGNAKAKIHDAGFLLECKSFDSNDVALHKSPDFFKNRPIVTKALNQIKQTSL
jgi:glycosyltransferase involved in cell wall biosynthesis